MKIGTLCYSTDQGLGVLARSFYNAGVVTNPILVAHSKRQNHPEWYPTGTTFLDGKLELTDQLVAEIRTLDVMLFFETPFLWELIPLCRDLGVKTFLMPMYECEPRELPYQPDFFINPSLLDQQYYPNRSEFIPVPADGVKWKLRKEAYHFVHNAGHGGLKGRNGTTELLKAMEYVKSPIKLTVRHQDQLPPHSPDSRVTTVDGTTVPYDELWDDGDVFVFPEKFNGLSLPLQEAYASGMLVMATNRFPMNTWLPTEHLIRTSGSRTVNISPRLNNFAEAVVDPKDIAERIDSVFGRSIEDYSLGGKAWAEENSWAVLKHRYMESLSR